MPVLNRLVSRALVGLFLVALLPATSFAQFDTATVLGTVKDSSGAVVPGATVTLKNTATGITANAVTDADGNYQFLNVRDRHLHRPRRAAGLLGRRSQGRRGHRRAPASAST